MTRKTARFSWVAVAVGVGLAAPASAAAAEPGVNYDPGSPAGKEYVIPLAGGRADAAGTPDQQRGGNVPCCVGIRPPGGRAGHGGGASLAASGGEPGSNDTAGPGAGGSAKNGGAGSGQSFAPREGNGRSSSAGRGRGRSSAAGGASNGGNLRSRIGSAEAVGGTGGPTLLIALSVLVPAALLAVVLQRRHHLSRGGKAA